MEAKIQPKQDFHMIIRLIDQKPALVIPRYAHRPLQNTNSFATNLSNQRQNQTPMSDNEPKIIQNSKTEDQRPKKDAEGDPQRYFGINGILQGPQSQKKMVLESLSSKIKPGKRSLIDELTNIMEDTQVSSNFHDNKNRLETLEWIETNSFHDQEYYDFDDNESEILELTSEERQFFNNFVQESSTQRFEEEEEPFTALEIIPAIVVLQKSQDNDNLPANKTKVARNFFRSKGSMIKDQKTCQNSQTFLEEQLKKGKEKLNASIEIIEDKIAQ